MIDTCQANTMYSKFYSPNIISCGSSALHESSYSHHSDTEIGVAVIDRFTYYTLEFLENITTTSKSTLQDLFDYYTYEKIHSNVGISTELFNRDPKDVLITDFFGNVQKTVVDEPDEDLLYVYDGDENDYDSESKLRRPSDVSHSKLANVATKESSKNAGSRSNNVITLAYKENTDHMYSYALTATVIVLFIFAYNK